MIEEPIYVNQLSPFYKAAYQRFKELYLPKTSITEREEIFKAYCQEFTVLPHLFQIHLINLKPIEPNLLRQTNEVPVFNFCMDPDFYFKLSAIDFWIQCIPRHLYSDEIYDFILSEKVEFDSNKLKNYNGFYFPMLKMSFDKTVVEVSKHHNMELMEKEMIKFEAILILPHKFLDETMEFYKKWSVKFISPSITKKFNEAKILYTKLIAAGDDDVKWHELILQSNNEKFIIYCFNCRIGKNPLNVNQWKMLMEYLYAKTKNYSELFSTFSRYCRFFVDDLEMRRMYFNQLSEITKTGKCFANFWRDLIDIERKFATKESVEILLKTAISVTDSEKQLLSPHENFGTLSTVQPNNDERKCLVPKSKIHITPKMTTVFHKNQILQQATCFPTFMVTYILNNAPFPVLQRLYQSAKYFFIKQPKLLCFQLNVKDNFGKNKIEFVENSAFIEYRRLPENFYVTNSFFCSMSRNEPNINIISSLIKNVKLWKLSYIGCKAYLTLSDLKILIKDSKIYEADFGWSTLLETNRLTIQEFIDLFPHAYVIKIPNGIKCSADTSQALQTMKRSTKLKEFFNTFQSMITPDVDPQAFCDFIKNNAAPNAKFDINVDHTCLNIYTKLMESFMRFWQPQSHKPTIKVWRGNGPNLL